MGMAGLKPMLARNRSTTTSATIRPTNTAAGRGRLARSRSAMSATAAAANGSQISSELSRTIAAVTVPSTSTPTGGGGGWANPQATFSPEPRWCRSRLPAATSHTTGIRKIVPAAASTTRRLGRGRRSVVRSSSPQPASSARLSST